MKLRTAVSCLALVALAAALAPAGGTAGPARCTAAKSGTIVDDGEARVYKDRRTSQVIGCMRSVGKRVTLGLDADEGIEDYSVYRVRLAAPYVASVQSCGCRDYNRGNWPELTVRDLRTGTKFATVYRDGSNFTDVVLGSAGAVAWIAAQTPSTPATYEVARVVAGGEVQVVDSGTNINPRSLVLGGDGTMYWSRGGSVSKAPLRP